jgi:hypothetical protein
MTLRWRRVRSTALASLLAACAASGCSDDGAGENSCDRAKAIQNEILAERDKDAARGLIGDSEAPCNFTPQAMSSLAPDRLRWYADACARYQNAASGCKPSTLWTYGGSPEPGSS